MKQKTVSIILAFALAFSLAACSSGNDAGTTPGTTTPVTTPAATEPAATDPVKTDEPAAPAEPGIDYTGGLPDGVVSNEPITLRALQWALDNQTTDFQNLWYYNRLEEETGVRVEFDVVKDSDYNTKLNLMFSTGDYPDILIRPSAFLDIEEYGVTQGALIPLDGYIEANMPNYAQRLKLNNVTESMYASDGKMYAIGYLIAQDINHEANWFINKTWLNAVGKAEPKTVDELTDVLIAFRDQAPGGEGTLPFSAGGQIFHQTQGLYTHFAMFGVPLQYFVYACIDDGNKVVFPGFMDGFREACEWLAMCYAENLLDKDSITQSDNDWSAKVNDNKVGFTSYLRLINTAWTNPDTIQNWVSIIPPSGTQSAKVPRLLEVPEFGAVLTNTNKHVPETLRWLDKQFETVAMLEAFNGPASADGPIDQTLELKDGKWTVNYIPEDNGLYKIVPVSQGQFFAPGDYYFDIFDLPPHRIERRDNSEAYEAAGVVEKNSYMILQKLIKLTTEENEERSRLHSDLDNFMRERITDFIMNGVTDASWNAFVSDAVNAGADRYVELYQKAYDAYLAGRS